jgi:hypothetical protein
MAAAGVQIGTLAALDAVRAGRDLPAAAFAEESALDLVLRDPTEMPRAIQMYQSEMAALGLTLNTAEAVSEIREYLDRMDAKPLPMAERLLRDAEAASLSKADLAREIKNLRGNWPFKGASRTSAELATVAIKIAAERGNGRPMTPAELASLGRTAAPA